MYDSHPTETLEARRFNVCYEYMYPTYHSRSFESLQMCDNETHTVDFGYSLHQCMIQSYPFNTTLENTTTRIQQHGFYRPNFPRDTLPL